MHIELGQAPAYQIRRYCWSAGLPFGLVSDFEEFAIYDCRAVPSPSDSAQVGRIAYFTYQELPDAWPVLLGMFGRDAVAAGALDRLAAAAKTPRKTRPIDAAFLDELRTWRCDLARDIATRNPKLDVVNLNRVVQTLIDRLVFLRIAESRGLEVLGALGEAASQTKGLHARLQAIFLRADDRYNSGLFHSGVGNAGAGESGEPVAVSDALLQRIVKRLYFPEPYEFSVLPADIPGRIYEQFLGEVLSLTREREATVELKPEVRKAGGVYYTPTPIVDYIVQQTLEPLLKGKTPNEVASLSIVDPACGSGSFLIAAFQFLLNWHRDYYAERPVLAKRFLENSPNGEVRVRSQERKRILLYTASTWTRRL